MEMLEVRVDTFTRRRVLIVHGRGARPSDWPAHEPLLSEEDCPFCPGHEKETPAETWALREGPPNSPSWQIRAIPNKYPISDAHELIIETPAHGKDLPALPQDHVQQVISAYKTRLEALAQQGRWRYLALFKNYGRAAGATRAHPHAQLVGFPLIPPLIREELQMAERSYRPRRRCPYCEMIERELALKERVIDVDGYFLVWSPYAARVPFECWVLPRRHAHDFLMISAEELSSLACLLPRTLARLAHALRSTAYNYYLHTAPLPPSGRKKPAPTLEYSYHWHFEILPRLGQLAGLEWGTGFYVNSVPPEEAAQRLRLLRSS